ncbi:hypothetical protein A9G45_08275 [Gilliamella sp. HK2]|jgi:hypothetical protein|uniref:hypothetical protein n=1 Tax=unclassified Gilliamella TaxID=2685620 RepID=UPI00080E3950|nr:hypothetical protein [Gilliamella apicola]OCG27724.1 hypothetical protein A9G45_08275 [Gilliamella apicola]OCG29844.1 hypothetical protein A9G46_12720 [Gilliamella apicola]
MSNTTEKCLVLKQSEINALKKLIMYIKFSCKEAESLLYAGSPLINNIFDKLLEVDDFKAESKYFYKQENVTNEQFIRKKIQKDQDETLNKADEKLILELFKACLHPFSSSKDV